MRVLEELPLGDGKPVLVIGTADLLDLLAISPGALSGLKARGIAVQRTMFWEILKVGAVSCLSPLQSVSTMV